MATAIVLGGGLSGMAAANTVMENGGKVILLDKSAFCGGNSTKATSGKSRTKVNGFPETKQHFSLKFGHNDKMNTGLKCVVESPSASPKVISNH